MAISQNIIINLEGKSTGLQKAAATGVQSLSMLNQSINKIATSNTRWDASLGKLRGSNGQFVGTAKQAKAAAAQLAAEKARLAKIDDILTASLTKQEKALLQGAGLMQGMAHAGGSANFAVLSLTQGVQDMGQFGVGAAQGIRAVNNNVQQFATALTFASAQAGGMGKAFKLMGRQMMGPAGILFAFSAITAAIEAYSNQTQGAKKETEDAAKAWDDAAGSLLTFQNALSGKSFKVPESALRGIADALRVEVANIDANIKKAGESLSTESGGIWTNALTGAQQMDPLMGNIARSADDIKKSLEDTEASDFAIELARKNQGKFTEAEVEARKTLLRSMDIEIAKNEKLAEIYRLAEESGLELTSNKKESRRVLTEIEKLEQSRLILVNRLSSNEDEIVGKLTAQVAVLKDQSSARRKQSGLQEELFQLSTEEGIAIARSTYEISEQNSMLKEKIRLRKEELGIIGTDLTVAMGTLAEITNKMRASDFDAIAVKEMEIEQAGRVREGLAEEARLKNLIAILDSGNNNSLTFLIAEAAALSESNKELRERAKLKLIERGYSAEEIDIILDNTDKVSEKLTEAERLTIRLNKAFHNAATQGLAGLVSGLAQMAVSGGGASQLLLPFANMAIQLGKIAIGAGIGIEAIKTAFANLSGFKAIAIGASLVALGTIVKSRIKKTGKSAGAGGSSMLTASNSYNAGNYRGSGLASMVPSPMTYPFAGNRTGVEFLGGGIPEGTLSPPVPRSGSGVPQYRMVVEGRDIVSVSENEYFARGRVMGSGLSLLGSLNNSSSNTNSSRDRII